MPFSYNLFFFFFSLALDETRPGLISTFTLCFQEHMKSCWSWVGVPPALCSYSYRFFLFPSPSNSCSELDSTVYSLANYFCTSCWACVLVSNPAVRRSRSQVWSWQCFFGGFMSRKFVHNCRLLTAAAHPSGAQTTSWSARRVLDHLRWVSWCLGAIPTSVLTLLCLSTQHCIGNFLSTKRLTLMPVPVFPTADTRVQLPNNKMPIQGHAVELPNRLWASSRLRPFSCSAANSL